MKDTQRDLPADRLWQPTTAKWFAVVFGASLVYAVVRYHLAGDVAWRHFPLFILNKSTSLAALVALVPLAVKRKLVHETHKREERTS